MSELTYKKITDVEQIETLNDAATVFINDNGAMKQVGADKFGAVKTVNGIAPENGNIALEISQADWSVNDETNPAYVKNRMFYDGELSEVYYIEETTHDFSQGSYEPGNVSIPLDNGGTYIITWDGVEYERTPIDPGWGQYYLGNGSGWDFGDDTGEPFFIVDEGYGLYVADTTGSSAAHTFSVRGMTQHIEKLPERFLPDCAITTNNILEHTVGQQSYDANGQKLGEVFNVDSLWPNSAIGPSSHAEGQNTTASGTGSHAEGGNTTASGHYSHAEGQFTTASGHYSHAEGQFTTASCDYSHAEGYGTIASSTCQHVQGKYNIEDTSSAYAHIVGNGTNSNARSNAHTIDWSGNAWFAGTVEGTGVIIPSSTAGSTKRFLITVDDTGAITATEVTA